VSSHLKDRWQPERDANQVVFLEDRHHKASHTIHNPTHTVRWMAVLTRLKRATNAWQIAYLFRAPSRSRIKSQGLHDERCRL